MSYDYTLICHVMLPSNCCFGDFSAIPHTHIYDSCYKFHLMIIIEKARGTVGILEACHSWEC
jgi:hypothetical protein